MSSNSEEDFYRENKTNVGKELYHIFRQIDRRLLIIPSDDFFSKEFILGYNCRLMKENADQILDFASEYDFDGCPEVNGFYSWIRVINNFGSLVLSSFSRKGIRATLHNKDLIRTSFIILSSLDVVLKIRSDSLAQENNSVLLSDAGSLVKKDHQLKTNDNKRSVIDAEGQEEDGIIGIQKDRMTNDDNEEDGYRKTNDGKTTSSDDSMTNNECSRNRSLFSLYESFMTEAILMYHECIHDPSLGLKDKLSLWSTFISLLADKSALPLNQMISLGSSLLSTSISPITSGLLGNAIVSMFINNPIISVPYLTTSAASCATRKAINIPGSEWVVNPGQKKQIYRRMDYNSVLHNFGFNEMLLKKKSSSDKNLNKKEIILFCSSSQHESCYDISCQTSLSSIEVILSNDSTCFLNDLQKLVDLYVWLMMPGVSSKGKEERGKSCKQILGFKPEAMTLIGSGPQAGRTMMSLCLMIREINNVVSSNDIMKFPSRVFTINANFLSKLLMSPSRTLSFIKTINGNLLPDTLSSLESLELPSKNSRRRSSSGRRTSSYPGAAFIKLSSERGITFPDGHVMSLANLALMQAFSLVGMTKSSMYEALMLLKNVPFTLSTSINFFSPAILLDPLLHPLGFVSNRFTKLFDQHKKQDESEETDPIDEERDSGDEYDDEFFYDSPSNVENWSNLSRKNCTRESNSFMSICEKIPQFNAAASNPFVSPLLFHDFASLKSIELHLITSHFDESLDDNVSLARVWNGKVHLHVIQDNFIDLTLQQMKSRPVSTSDGQSIIINCIKSEGSYNRIK